MGRCIFNAKEVIPLIQHAVEKAPEAGKKPALILVHDQGVYLMSNGVPILPNRDGKEGSHVVYAENCHPEKDENFWTNARELVGGDDFAENWPIDDEAQLMTNCQNYDLLIFHVNPTNIRLTFAHDVSTKIHN